MIEGQLVELNVRAFEESTSYTQVSSYSVILNIIKAPRACKYFGDDALVTTRACVSVYGTPVVLVATPFSQ